MSKPRKKPRPHWIIDFAKALGFSPTAKQATKINCRSANLYADAFGGNPPKRLTREHQEIFNRTMSQAIEEVMTAPILKSRLEGR